MPRPWLFQGLITGINIAIGYGLGVLIGKLFTKFIKYRLDDEKKRIIWIVLGVAWALLTAIYFWKAQTWQADVRELVSMPEIERTYFLRISLLAFLTGWVLINAGRGTRKLTRKISNVAEKKLPHAASVVVGVVGTILIFVLVFNIVFAKFFVDISNNMFGNINNRTDFAVTQPESELRSGSPASLVEWDDLGRQGRNFVGRGPQEADLKKFSDDVKDPIRVYVGLKNEDTPEKRAELAVEELERTDAFSRKILVVAVPTGSGWIEPQGVDSIEYIYGGNSAIVSTQYSYLPSWIAFLTDQKAAQDSGRTLFDAVYEKWSTLPEETRPKLVVYGLSLGAFGAQAAFKDVDEIVEKTDGTLFVGSPSDTELWSQITRDRDKGSKQILPVYRGGEIVRFASNNDDINEDQSNWNSPRVLYLQHATDGVVWFDFDLILNRPDWLREEHGREVSPRMGWHPFVTFWQVTVDQMLSTNVPSGYGHNYGNTMVAAWASIAAPEGWTAEKTIEVQKVIDGYGIE